jgi:NTE family protein
MGCILNNIPVDVVRDMGANIVIAINIETPLSQLAANSSFISVTEQTIYAALLRNSQEALQKADVVVMPNLEGFTSTDFVKARDVNGSRLSSHYGQSRFIAIIIFI